MGVPKASFPKLTSGLVGAMGGFYTHADIDEIVTFANARGILVIPEVDLPGHAAGLLPLKQYGATFCNGMQMFADDAGKTNSVLAELVREYANLFGSRASRNPL